jgi:hypothetical protein
MKSREAQDAAVMGPAQAREPEADLFRLRPQAGEKSARRKRRKMRDLPCMEFTTTMVVEIYRVCCPDCR